MVQEGRPERCQSDPVFGHSRRYQGEAGRGSDQTLQAPSFYVVFGDSNTLQDVIEKDISQKLMKRDFVLIDFVLIDFVEPRADRLQFHAGHEAPGGDVDVPGAQSGQLL